jgi:radical SAM-linked protein
MQRPAPPGPPPAPVAHRMVIRYAKRGRMRFASHRDIARAVERGVRMAGLPVAYSAGFSPHPKISYAGGAPTGVASEAEYLEIALTGACTAADVRDRLDAALPDGIDVVEVFELAPGGAARQQDAEPAGHASAASAAGGPLRLEASHWRVELPGIGPDDAARAIEAFLAAGSIEVDRLTNKGIRRLDARSAVLTLELDRRASEGRNAGCAILRMVVRHMTPAVRPDDILAALGHVAALAPTSPALVTRLAQGPIGMAAAAARTSEPGAPGPAGSSGLAGPSGPAQPSAARPRPSAASAGQGQEKATCLGAEGAFMADTAPVSAYEQLSCGAEGRDPGPRAREPDGRDCPDARQRATQHRNRQ